MRKIYVRNLDLGFWTAEPITVVRREDGEIVYCNHAAADTEKVTADFPNYIKGDVDQWDIEIEVCGKCGAVRRDDFSKWEDAPLEGKTEVEPVTISMSSPDIKSAIAALDGAGL